MICIKKVKIAILIIFIFTGITNVSFADDLEEQYIKKYLGSKTQKLNTGLFSDEGNELILVFEKENDKIQNAIVYNRNKDVFSLNLLIIGPLIKNGTNQILIDLRNAPGKFYGFEIEIYSIEFGKAYGITIQWWANDGKSTTDPFYLVWDKKNDRFRLSKVDITQY